METTALVMAYVGVALMVGLAGIASAMGTSICGQAAVGAMKKNGGAFGSYMILSALPGSQGLYGFVCFFMVQGMLANPTMLQGAAILGAGILVGIVNLAAAVYQLRECRCVRSIQSDDANLYLLCRDAACKHCGHKQNYKTFHIVRVLIVPNCDYQCIA